MPERRPVVGIRIGIDPGHLVKIFTRSLPIIQPVPAVPGIANPVVGQRIQRRLPAVPGRHTLAEVEEVVTGTRTADDAYDSYLRVKEGQQPDDE